MSDSSLVALKAVVAKLLATTGLTTIVSTRVYTDVPQQTTFPYVAVDITSEPWAQMDASNMKHTFSIHGYSRKNSPTEALNISSQAFSTLDRQEAAITIDSGSILTCTFSGVKTVFKDTDGITWHSVIEFEMIVN